MRRMEDAIRAVVDLIHCPGAAAEQLTRATALFETLPMPNSDYVYITSRLENATKYAKDGESGAARYELTMISKRLVCQLKSATRCQS